jgi:uncharacterized membrane protein YecN with MAPEG domain
MQFQAYYSVALVTLLTALVYFWMALTVARTHAKVGILAPTMVGDPLLERTVRAHANTCEWLWIFMPSLWLFALAIDPNWAAGIGLVWIVGRILYFVGYRKEALRRFPGFFIQSTAAFVLLLGAVGRIVYLMIAD